MKIIVGDIHGCLEEFDELLRKVEFRKGEDDLILLGDLIDRGPDSIGVVRRAQELGAVSVLGNHEDKYLGFRMREEQLRRGEIAKNAREFSDEKRAVYNQLSDADWRYFELMQPWAYVDEAKTYVAVHAGFEPGIPPFDQRDDKVCRVVYVGDDGRMKINKKNFRKKPGDSKRWAIGFNWFSVVYGHVVFSMNHVQKDFVGPHTHYGIDTGCYAGGMLTALVWDDDVMVSKPVIVQVRARQIYMNREISEL